MSIDEGNESSDRERPFEHWYRGEAARNGGVGELKIGRAEMMDIAKFGHKPSTSPIKRSSPLGFDVIGMGRRRAGSMDDKRESWIMDEAALKMSKVIDESPLTDIEGDEYTTEGERSYPYPIRRTGLGVAVPSPSAGHSRNTSAGYSGNELDESTYVMVEEDTTMSTTPTALSSLQLGSQQRSGAKAAAAAQAQSPQGQRRQQQQQQASAAAAGGKAPLGQNNGVSPPKASSIPKPGQAKGKAKPKSRQSKNAAASSNQQREQEEEEEEVEDAEKIPYRRPPAKGNWDDIVLPAVSKKMGIEGYGLKSETGNILEISEEVRKRMSNIQPPVRYRVLYLCIPRADYDLKHRFRVYLDMIYRNIGRCSSLKRTSTWLN
jgi:serine/arginine repetitive matrix protein 1